METKIISKQDLNVWLKAVSERMEVLGPVAKNGVTRYEPIGDTEMDLEFSGPAKSLREEFTPETETLFEYKLSGPNAEVTPVDPDVKDRFIFGARACDAAALRYVDAVYGMVKPVDTPYFQRREHTVIAGLFCNNPAWSCFCTEVGDFLMDPIEMDLYFTDIGDKYLVRAYTPRGEEMLNAPQFAQASDEDMRAEEEVRNKALSMLPARAEREKTCLTHDWSHRVWEKLMQKCLGCGICAFTCPTCHCFDIQECPQGSKGSRFRCWDTCQFEKFTLMGHGHNPRPSKKERTRQRVFHKFKYSVERYGILGCVGCGRCIAACPVNIDIKQVIDELESEAPVNAF